MADASESPRPFWMPPGVELEKLPEGLRAAFEDIIDPAYRQLVVENPDPLEKSLAAGYVYACWLALLEQHELGKIIWYKQASLDRADHYTEPRDRLLRVLGTQDKLARSLLQLRAFRKRTENE